MSILGKMPENVYTSYLFSASKETHIKRDASPIKAHDLIIPKLDNFTEQD